ncbi:MAG TPA: aminoglycoside 6-adenylyltransferase [Anaerolineales bacterium]|nr:aminoglycoside 6-adenylyltransferase [Anaerolineales bacterium]
MNAQSAELSEKHSKILDRFVAACQADERVVAAFLVGSYVNGKPDAHSDLDLYLVTTDDDQEDFVSTRESFVRLLGEPLLVEDFDIPHIVFLIFSDGSEVEIHYHSESQLGGIFDAPYKVLLDKKKLTGGIVSLAERQLDQEKQTEKLRRLISWFWHDFSHFVTAMSREQLWWAHGQLEVLRSICVGLARLANDFGDADVEDEVYFKIEKMLPAEKLLPLSGTFCPLDKKAMLESAYTIVDFYHETATSLAQTHEIIYPDGLEHLMVNRLKQLHD